MDRINYKAFRAKCHVIEVTTFIALKKPLYFLYPWDIMDECTSFHPYIRLAYIGYVNISVRIHIVMDIIKAEYRI